VHLGLSVVRQRVQALSGSLTISAAAPGTRVHVAFPAAYGGGASP
jgi:signal transduction histidine kinase